MTPHDNDPSRVDLSTGLRRLGATDDGADAAGGLLAGMTTALTARVRRGRRRRAGAGASALALVIAAALVLVPGSPTALLDRSAPRPTPTSGGVGVDGLCGLALDPAFAASGTARLAITVAAERSTVTADEPWSADVTHGLLPGIDPAASTERLTWDDTELVLVATQGAVAGDVVGVGQVPLAQGGTVDASDASGARAHYATGFVDCDGDRVPAGQYSAMVVDLVDPATATAKDLTSEALPLTVRAASSTPEGTTRPAWLKGTSLWCGMTDNDLFRAMPDDVDAPVTTNTSPVSPPESPGAMARPGVRVSNLGPDDVTVTVGTHPSIAWIDARTKKVVTFGPDELRSTRELTVKSGGAVDYRAAGYDTTDYCAGPDDSLERRVPPGVYLLVLYTRIAQSAVGGSTAFLHAPGPEVQVRHDGSVTTDLSGQPAAAATALALVKDGHQPAWLQGSGLACGMTDWAYTERSWPDPPAVLAGSFSSSDGRVGSTLTPAHHTKVAVTTPPHLGLAWFTSTADDEPGTLVSFGADPGTGRALDLGRDGGVERFATLDTTDTCAPYAGGGYGTRLPPGDYWVAFYTWVRTPGGDVRQWLTDDGAMGITVADGGSVAGR